MGKHKKAKSTGRQAHFTGKQRQAACGVFKSVFKGQYGSDPVIVGKKFQCVGKLSYAAQRGCKGDAVCNAAHRLYTNGAGEDHEEETPREHCSSAAFLKVVRTWYARWRAGESCERMEKPIILTEADVELCLQHIGEPFDELEGSYIHYSSISKAVDASPELQEMQARYGGKNKLTPTRLHKILVDDLKVLSHNMPDVKEPLCPRTLKSRRDAAEVWSGRVPWMQQASPAHRGGVQVDTYFKQEFYEQFTFMIDAVGMEDGPGSKPQRRAKVYRVAHKLWGPHLVGGQPGLKQASKMMIYVALHPEVGIVCGPDLVYTGSKVPLASKAEKAALLKQW